MEDTWCLTLTDKELAEKMGLSVKTIQRYNKALIEKGYLRVIKSGDDEIKIFDFTEDANEK